MERRKEVVGEIFVPRRGAADDAGRASQALLFGGASGFTRTTILKQWIVTVIDPTRSPKTDFL